MKELLLDRPSIALAFWWNTLQDEGLLRERIIDEGRRDAFSRIGFLIYEIFVRMRAFGDIVDENFEFPITQVDLADATGLTPVHARYTETCARKDKDRDNREAIVKAPHKTNNWDHGAVYVTATQSALSRSKAWNRQRQGK
ncbi:MULTISPECIES: hypothetical protein [unclassified Mesorhizobium]|uniref:hypothetical protein n=1 Tax=unclassified Mesorhizobium TaxID=325217 RepID=UPI00112EF883|nr:MULTISPECIES: hypothetical protein [unclassified Mesorhizobium]TPJ46081.1 hypothetical protein FJ437_15535 [Mesorhizobium sp. B2-6-6]MBZ9982359.1 hypothetical protein [Mesorhizobium sp. BR-1-1-8]MCA0008582.1 hypothetical protein [Mesorhizobium sp. B264B1B]MCA0018819.1 hypothetical protein [Mesorhizobium sp. B264B1A]MCA0025802.1 hypothetical protein [Mesorhizobium sp. B263B1A]